MRKLFLLSVLLMSASSVTAPMYAMIDGEGDVVQAPRVKHLWIPGQLTQDMIPGIRRYGSFLTTAKEYVLQNTDQLDIFARYLNPDLYSPFTLIQSAYTDDRDLHYYIMENSFSRRPNPHYDPTRPEDTGPEWFEGGHFAELSRLTFKEQDLAFVSGSVAASSMQVSSFVDSSHEVDAETMAIIRSLIELDRLDQAGLSEF